MPLPVAVASLIPAYFPNSQSYVCVFIPNIRIIICTGMAGDKMKYNVNLSHS